MLRPCLGSKSSLSRLQPSSHSQGLRKGYISDEGFYVSLERGWRELIQHKECAPWTPSAPSCDTLARAAGCGQCCTVGALAGEAVPRRRFSFERGLGTPPEAGSTLRPHLQNPSHIKIPCLLCTKRLPRTYWTSLPIKMSVEQRLHCLSPCLDLTQFPELCTCL